MTTKFPEKPKVGDRVLVFRKAECGCVYDILCQWDGRLWAYISDQWCPPHGNYGWKVVKVLPYNGELMHPQKESMLEKVVKYEEDTNGGHIPLATMQILSKCL
jgi:hypothetical protein